MADLISQLNGATNTLLEEPPLGAGRDVCTSLLTEGAAEPNVVFVTFIRRATACLDQIDRANIGRVGIVTVGDGSAAVDDRSVVTESISTPSDLTGLGVTIGEFLSEFDEPVHVCFDSLTSLLQYVDLQIVYEFLHAVTGQIHAASARAHFHVDPAAHDEPTVEAIASLLDARISLATDEPEIETRDLLVSADFSHPADSVRDS